MRLNQEKEEEKLAQENIIAAENESKRQENERLRKKEIVSMTTLKEGYYVQIVSNMGTFQHIT